MTVARGDKHTFVGMNFKILDDGKVKIDMIHYIKECFELYRIGTIKNQFTPRAHDLFEVDEKSQRLDKRRSEVFYRIAAKLLYVAKCAGIDAETTVSFLCTRVT